MERSRSRDSALEVTFGLKVQVKALRDVRAKLNGVDLKAGTKVEATLEDRIIFHNDTELDLLDLRRRARAMGGRFQLKASQVRISRLEQSRACSRRTTSCFRPAPRAMCC